MSFKGGLVFGYHCQLNATRWLDLTSIPMFFRVFQEFSIIYIVCQLYLLLSCVFFVQSFPLYIQNVGGCLCAQQHSRTWNNRNLCVTLPDTGVNAWWRRERSASCLRVCSSMSAAPRCISTTPGAGGWMWTGCASDTAATMASPCTTGNRAPRLPVSCTSESKLSSLSVWWRRQVALFWWRKGHLGIFAQIIFPPYSRGKSSIVNTLTALSFNLRPPEMESRMVNKTVKACCEGWGGPRCSEGETLLSPNFAQWSLVVLRHKNGPKKYFPPLTSIIKLNELLMGDFRRYLLRQT